MKTFTIFAVLMCACIAATAQSWEFGTDLRLTQPGKGMTTMNTGFGMGLGISRNLKAPFALGLEMSFGTYGSETTRQLYTFDDGSTTETNVRVSNNIFNLNATGKYFLRNEKKFNPYLSGKIGWSRFATNLSIEDPQDPFACEPIESDILYHDETITATAGAGFRLDLSTLFPRISEGNFFLDASFHTIQGGTVRYMNVEIDPSKPAPARDVTAKFINQQSQVIHEHHVGYVYSGLVDMFEYRLGVICRPSIQNYLIGN